MPIEYRIDEALGIVRHEFTGEISRTEFERYWEMVLSDPSVPEPLVMMADMREWTLTIDGEDVFHIVRDAIAPRIGDRRWIAAAVVSCTSQYGVARQFTSYSDGFGVTEIFTDLDSALEWLIATAGLRTRAAGR
jgi:hypothetical protein